MTEYYSLFIVNLDNKCEDELCWDEIMVKIDEDEKKEGAIRLLASWGWEFLPDNRCVCPYCGKGIEKGTLEKSNLRRIK